MNDETGTDYFRHVATVIGDHPSQAAGGRLGDLGLPGGADAHLGEVTIELAPAELRTYSSEQLGLMWRDETGPVPEAVAIEIDTSLLDAPARRPGWTCDCPDRTLRATARGGRSHRGPAEHL